MHEPGFVDAHVEYLERTPHTDWGTDVSRAAERQSTSPAPASSSTVLAIHRFVGSHLTYAPGATYVGVDIDEVFARRQGVCQDFAHLAVLLVPGRRHPGPVRVGLPVHRQRRHRRDGEGDVVRVQTHAWFEAAIPGFGWLALDPTNGLEVGPRHVKIGHGRDYDDVPPVKGVFKGEGRPTTAATVEIRRPPAAATAAVALGHPVDPGFEQPPLPVRCCFAMTSSKRTGRLLALAASGALINMVRAREPIARLRW